MGLSDSIIGFSIGLHNDIAETYDIMKEYINKVGVLEIEMV